jgi:hypothetical protein
MPLDFVIFLIRAIRVIRGSPNSQMFDRAARWVIRGSKEVSKKSLKKSIDALLRIQYNQRLNYG